MFAEIEVAGVKAVQLEDRARGDQCLPEQRPEALLLEMMIIGQSVCHPLALHCLH